VSDLRDEIDFALRLADAADEFTLPRFQAREFSVELKANATEVTEVDRGAESLVMDMIRTERPHHAWYGEEHGTGGKSEWTWVVDPIDGTSNFVRGVPVWATLIGLVHADLGPVLGVVSAPAMHTRWWGGRDLGAYCNGRPITVSTVSELSEASVSITDNAAWRDAGHGDWLKNIKRAAKRLRGYGDFWQHMLVAQGAVDLAIDAIGLEPYDIAAMIPIVEAAGGRLVDRSGNVNWRADTAITGTIELVTSVTAGLRPRPS
jgi:histidinol-phosphatase